MAPQTFVGYIRQYDIPYDICNDYSIAKIKYTYCQLDSGGGKSPIVVKVNVDQYKDLRYFLVTFANSPSGFG